MKGVVDITALALERYPLPEQEGERRAFIEGFMIADPSKVMKSPDRKRVKFGDRSGFFRDMEVGETVQVPIVDSRDWNLWRTTASLLHKSYGCRFSVRRNKDDRNMLMIHRYE